MLNKIWAFMILGGILCGALTGRMEEVTKAALDGAGEAVTLCITMAGVVALWMGLMEIAKEAGLVERMTKGIAPFLTFLFPRIPKGHPALEYIATNVIANVLGLGWACTPAGLKAMEALADLEAQRGNPEYMAEDKEIPGNMEGRKRVSGNMSENKRIPENLEKEKRARKAGRRASNEMCNFLILNISSLQLIPVNMIAYRSQYGSENPAAIVAPAILATLISTIVAVIFCKCMELRRKVTK